MGRQGDGPLRERGRGPVRVLPAGRNDAQEESGEEAPQTH